MQKLVVYFSCLNTIGGVETFAKIFVKKMSKHYNITFLYGADKGSTVEYISKYATLEVYKGQEVFCDIFISMTTWGVCCSDSVTADLKVLMIHGNYSASYLSGFTPKLIGKFDTFVAVSPSSAKGFKERYGILPTVIYNLVDIEDEDTIS